MGCHNYHKGGNQKKFVAIQYNPTIEWWLKFFNHLKRHGGDDLFFKSDGDFFQLPQKGGVSCFWKAFNDLVVAYAMIIEIIWLLPKCQEFFSCVLDAKWPCHIHFDNLDHILKAQFLFLWINFFIAIGD